MTDESMSYLEALTEIKRLKEALEQQPCENCKHYKLRIHDYKDLSIYGCSAWNCHFEPKESADESTKKTADGKSETGDMCNASL